MPDAIWVDKNVGVSALVETLAAAPRIGVDTEFLRERTFFPKLCVLQLAVVEQIWCIDALPNGILEPLVPALTTLQTPKIIHSARQDLEAVYLTTRCIMAPVFDTQIAAGCVGLKPQIGYAELVKTLLDVSIPKGQTRTDWSKRPLTHEQLEYAADDVLYLGDVADVLLERLQRLGREHWALEDCAALQNPLLYEPDPSQVWERLRGIGQLAPGPRARAKGLAVWREKIARARDLPRAWILPDAALFAVAQANPGSRSALGALKLMPANFNDSFAEGVLQTLKEAAQNPLTDREPGLDARPTPEQKLLIDRLAKVVDARAAELDVSPELLAPRGELKALAAGARDSHALSGWRHAEIGARLLAVLD
jgi:ribonuclease D